MAVYVVTSDSDTPREGYLTLRQAIQLAEESAGADVIRFDRSISTVTLTSVSALFVENGSEVTIDGARTGANGDPLADVVISAGGNGRHMVVREGAALDLQDLVLVEADYTAAKGATGLKGRSGGVIESAGDLSLDGVRFEGNTIRGGDGGTGRAGTDGYGYSGKAAKGKSGENGGSGLSGKVGGEGGDAATILALGGSVDLTDVVVAEDNSIRQGNGGRGGQGGDGGDGQGGGDFTKPDLFTYVAYPGGRGGDGGFAGVQGKHGDAALGLLAADGVEVSGTLIVNDEQRTAAQKQALRDAPGGDGGKGGAGGNAPLLSKGGEKGADGADRASYRSPARELKIDGVIGAEGLEVYDALFKVSTGVETLREGQALRLGFERLAADTSVGWSVDWRIAFDGAGIVTPRDFVIGPGADGQTRAVSGTVTFGADGPAQKSSNVALSELIQIARDGRLEAAETVRIEITGARALSGPEREILLPGAVSFEIASELPSPGDDDLVGTRGADSFRLLTGDDVARMRGGDDLAIGGAGRDRLFGEGGRDDLRGGGGSDRLFGGGGNDKLAGGGGADQLRGGGGADALFGGGGNDVLRGGPGNDRLLGGPGRDVLRGEQGADLLKGGAGDDRLFGGQGPDVFAFGGRDGRDVVLDFREADAIRIDGGATRFGQLRVTQENGDAVIRFAQTEIVLDGVRAATVGADDFIF